MIRSSSLPLLILLLWLILTPISCKYSYKHEYNDNIIDYNDVVVDDDNGKRIFSPSAFTSSLPNGNISTSPLLFSDRTTTTASHISLASNDESNIHITISYDQESKGALAFVLLIMLIMMIGIVICIRWDAHDHNVLVYVTSENKERHAQQVAQRMVMMKNTMNSNHNDNNTGNSMYDRLTKQHHLFDHFHLFPHHHHHHRNQQQDHNDNNNDIHLQNQSQTSITQVINQCKKWFRKNNGDKKKNSTRISEFPVDELNESFDDIWRFNIRNDDDFRNFDYDEDNDEGEAIQLNGASSATISSSSSAGIRSVIKYLNRALPANHLLLKQGYLLSRILSLLMIHHDYIAMFTYKSPVITRTMRWLGMWRGILVLLFVNSLYYGIVFPDTADDCPHYITEADCLAQKSLIHELSTVCSWNAITSQCSVDAPPIRLTFLLSSVLLIVAIGAPLDAILTFVMEDYCSRRPTLSHFNLTENSWLGSSFRGIFMGTIHHDVANKHWIQSKEYTLSAEELDTTALQIFEECSTEEEELDFILNKIKMYFLRDSASAENKDFMMQVITRTLDILPTGEPGPLTLWQSFFYGSARDRLLRKIKKVREDEQSLLKKFNAAESDSRDVVLLHAFILEQLSFFKRFALRRHLVLEDTLSTSEVNAIIWVLAWLLIWVVFGFLFYWIISWCLSIQGHTVNSWGATFAIACAQDIFFCQPFKVFLIYFLAVELSRSQLQGIYKTLLRVATTANEDHVLECRDNLRIVQHFSAACRAARANDVIHSPCTYILRHVNDADVFHCRDRRDYGNYLFAVVIVPLIMARFGTYLSDQCIEILVAGIVSGFVVSLHELYALREIFIIIPLVVIVGFLWISFVRQVRKSFLAKNKSRSRLSRRQLFTRSRSPKSWKGLVQVQLQRMLTYSMVMMGKIFSFEELFNSPYSPSLAWQHMNRNDRLQGRDESQRGEQETDECTELPEFGTAMAIDGTGQIGIVIPDIIRKLRPTKNDEQRQYWQELLDRRVFDATPVYVDQRVKRQTLRSLANNFVATRQIETQGDIPQNYEKIKHDDDIDINDSEIILDLAVYGNHEVVKSTRFIASIRNHALIVNDHLALKFVFRYCLRVIINNSAASSLEWFRAAKSCDCEVPVAKLEACLETLWSVYVPGGKPLDKIERIELMEMFQAFVHQNWDLGIITHALTWSEFIDWFIEMLDVVNRTRSVPSAIGD